MKSKNRVGRGYGLTLLMLLLSLASTAWAYDPIATSDYAFQWYNDYNPDYEKYDIIYDEDANFVSQALIAGGLLNSSKFLPGFAVNSAGCIITRESLAKYLMNYEHAKQVGFKVEEVFPTSLAHGDVVFFHQEDGSINRVGIVVGYNPVRNGLDIAMHWPKAGTTSTAGIKLQLNEAVLFYGLPTFYHITKPEETPDKQRFYGTGNFFDEDALSVEVLRPGNNYQGYIISNDNRSAQDMVIATDTSQPKYKGCSYLIAGYCCDPEKHTPILGQTFGQPWTSDSPAHWAFWVRKAVLYATANGFDSMQILNAVWYIVDRVGYPDDIISGIGYPEDGPMKLEMVYLPLITRPAGISAVPTLGLEGPVVKKPTRLLKSFQELYEHKRSRITGESQAGATDRRSR